jgi:hypothetical protein
VAKKERLFFLLRSFVKHYTIVLPWVLIGILMEIEESFSARSIGCLRLFAVGPISCGYEIISSCNWKNYSNL